MNKVERQRILDCLNEMEIIESQGGEEAYALVENNEENRALLEEAGIPLEKALMYGDSEVFCIISLAWCEGYANWYENGKLQYRVSEEFKVCLHKKNAHMLERRDDKWILDGIEIDQEHAISELVEAVSELGYWCQVAKDILPEDWFEEVNYAVNYEEE